MKRRAAEAALAYVKPGMALGLGTGSTARFFLEGVARLVAGGMELKGVPTSFGTADVAKELGIPLTSLEDRPRLDLCVDSADEVDPRLDLIKGLGGALFREKIVAAASDMFVVIVDESKIVPRLGTRAPVPIEVHPFGWRNAATAIEALGAKVELRLTSREVFQTDNGNRIVDARFPSIRSPPTLAAQIMSIPGVVGHGLFLGMADLAIVASEAGVRTLRRPKKAQPKRTATKRRS